MDKRRLYEDIAIIRRRIFALSVLTGFLVVTVASIWANSANPYRLFVTTALALVVFGILGFVAGIVYERLVTVPLVESYREEARRQRAVLGPEPLEMDLPVSELKSGMIVCDQVKSSEGAMLVRAEAVLTDRLISQLREKGVGSVRVKAQRHPVSTEQASSVS